MDQNEKKQKSMGNKTMIPPWSNVPNELVDKIGKCMDTYIDILRFRAVCNSWRNLLPPFKNSHSLPFKIPFPIDTERYYYECIYPDYYLIESTVYLFQPPDESCTGWLIKVTKTVDGKLRVFNPLTEKPLPADYNMPKLLNLLDFRVSQVSKSYLVQRVRPSRQPFCERDVLGYAKKILLHTDNFSLMAIDHGMANQLFYLKPGDEKWTKLKDASFNIVDIAVYKGNFYAVDRYGKTIKFDSSFNETVVSSIVDDAGRRKRLVESLEQLFLVDIVLDFDKPSIEIKTYRLDEEQHEWIQVHTLGDRIFFAGEDCCFSVSSQDFGEYCRGNHIYFANRGILPDILGGGLDDNGQYDIVKENVQSYYERVLQIDRSNTGVYAIGDGKFGPLLSFVEYADIFWPPPSWLNS